MRPLAAFVTLAAVLVASEARAAGLTLTEALEAAHAHNEIPRVSAERIRQARAARREALALLLPVLSASGTYRRRAREVVRNVGGTDVVIQRHDAFSAAATLEVPLLDPTAFPRIAAAGYEVDASRADADQSLLALWLDTAEAFFTVLAAEGVVEAAAHRVEAAELAARSARARFEAGLTDRNTATRAELEIATARLEGTRARNAVATARLSLGFLMGTDVSGALVAPEGPILAQVPDPRMARDALALRPDVRALEARVDAADALADEPWLRLLPQVSATGVATWTNEAGFSGNATDWTIAVTASWVAYDGGVRYAHAMARDAEQAELVADLDALRRQVRLEVRTALVELESATEALAQAEAQVEVAEQNRDEVTARFDHGLVDAVALADATQAAYDAAADLARQRLSLRLAELDLLRATGRRPEGAR